MNNNLAGISIGYGVCAALLLFVVQKVIARWVCQSKYKLPPRIPGLPILGNALQIPSTQQGPWAKQQAEKYGEM